MEVEKKVSGKSLFLSLNYRFFLCFLRLTAIPKVGR